MDRPQAVLPQENRLLKQFRKQQLNPDQAAEVDRVRSMFLGLAEALDQCLPENADKTMALRKLREAKDCAVIAIIYPKG